MRTYILETILEKISVWAKLKVSLRNFCNENNKRFIEGGN